jgi:hypothetical protein
MIDSYVKHLLGFDDSATEDEVRAAWAQRTQHVCKPCWELKYCPYGPLVEQFPLLPQLRRHAIEHNEFLKSQLAKGAYDEARQEIFEEEVATFKPEDYPEELDPSDVEKKCSVFGHLCPVFFVNEPFSETREARRITRHIPRAVMMRVVRRDNNQCQLCSRVLRDDEIEFDHIIPFAKGGATEEHNLRVTCYDCNRSKGDDYDP